MELQQPHSIALDQFAQVYGKAGSYAEADEFYTTEELLEQLQEIDPAVLLFKKNIRIVQTDEGQEEKFDLSEPKVELNKWLRQRQFIQQQLDGLKMVWLLVRK